MSNQTTASRRLGIPITGEPSQDQILSFDEDTESMVWIDNNNGGGDNNNTKTATLSVSHNTNTVYTKLPFNPRTDTIKNLDFTIINSGETTTLSYVYSDDAVKAPDDKVIKLILHLRMRTTGKCKFNIRASNTLNTADGNIVYSRDSERAICIYSSLYLSPLVIDAGKFLTIELFEGEVSVYVSSIVVTNDI